MAGLLDPHSRKLGHQGIARMLLWGNRLFYGHLTNGAGLVSDEYPFLAVGQKMLVQEGRVIAKEYLGIFFCGISLYNVPRFEALLTIYLQTQKGGSINAVPFLCYCP